MTYYLFWSMPYAFMTIIAIFDIPSFLLTRRYKDKPGEDYTTFAARWNSVAQIMVLPLIALFYAIQNLSSRGVSLKTPVLYLLIIVFIIIVMILGTYLALVEDISYRKGGKKISLPWFQGQKTISFGAFMRIMKCSGVLIPAVIDLLFTPQ